VSLPIFFYLYFLISKILSAWIGFPDDQLEEKLELSMAKMMHIEPFGA
jgi:hypothetical protein